MIHFKDQLLKNLNAKDYRIVTSVFESIENFSLAQSKPCLIILQSGKLKYRLNNTEEIELSPNQCFIFNGGTIYRDLSNEGAAKIIEYKIFSKRGENDFSETLVKLSEFIPRLTILRPIMLTS
jgi:hypothetical protein